MKTKTLLVVEDNEDDLFFLRRALGCVDIPHSVSVVNDGLAAVAYLSGDGLYADRAEYPLPSVVILDIALPRLNGHEVLGWIREQPRFKTLPIIILSNSAHPEDIHRAYRLGVTSYLAKQADLKEYHESLKAVLHYWLEVPAPAPAPPAKALRNQAHPALVSNSKNPNLRAATTRT
jgi:CheY-like chemotaxis protein